MTDKPTSNVSKDVQMQAMIREPQQGDNTRINISVIQAEKCAAIVGAARSGRSISGDALQLVEEFLVVSSLEAIGAGCRPSSDESWRRLDAEIWPSGGRHHRQ